MHYSTEEIRSFTNPYEVFANGDILAENQKALNKLTDLEKKALAIKIVTDCPQEQLVNLGHALRAVYSASSNQSSFHSFITLAHQIKTGFLSPKPHQFLRQLNPKHIEDFKDLITTVLKNNETMIAERLALFTPEQSRTQINELIHTYFPNSSFLQKVEKAFNNISLLGTRSNSLFASPTRTSFIHARSEEKPQTKATHESEPRP